MNFKAIPRLKKGFTLIELLVVIAILAGLASISIPTILGAMVTAKETTTRQKCIDIIQAIDNYQNDYNGNLPFTGENIEPDDNNQFVLNTANGEDANILAVLSNREKGDEERLNPDRNVYLRSDLSDDPINGLYINKENQLGLFDPWGKPYYIIISDENDGCIDPFTGESTYKNVIIYSLGSDQLGLPPESISKRPHTTGKAAKNADEEAEIYEETIADNVYSWKTRSK